MIEHAPHSVNRNPRSSSSRIALTVDLPLRLPGLFPLFFPLVHDIFRIRVRLDKVRLCLLHSFHFFLDFLEAGESRGV